MTDVQITENTSDLSLSIVYQGTTYQYRDAISDDNELQYLTLRVKSLQSDTDIEKFLATEFKPV